MSQTCYKEEPSLLTVAPGSEGLLRGEAGIGKRALLDYLVEAASGFRVVRASGVESEMELPFAGLHELCAPMLGRLGLLAEPRSRPGADPGP